MADDDKVDGPNEPDSEESPDSGQPESTDAPEAAGYDDIFANSDILGQDDIDSLLQQVTGDDDKQADASVADGAVLVEEKVILNDGRRHNPRLPLNIEPYDFRNPAFLGETEMRRLRLMHEDFIRFLEARFALFLRMDFSISMTKLTTHSYESAVDEVENPSHLVLFRANPLPGLGFLEINPRLALTIASTILGGKGQAPRMERYLTKIEVDLIEEFLIVLLQEWCSQWKTGQNLEPVIVGHEIVANVIQICERDTIMLSLSTEAQLRGCVGKIGIYVPLYMIEEPIRKLQSQRTQDNQRAYSKVGPAWHKGYEHIPVKGVGTLSMGEVSLREVKEKWKPGTIIKLPQDAMESITLSMANVPLFRGEVGVEDDHLAVKILEKKTKRGPLWNTKK